jgi:hypothetical protein
MAVANADRMVGTPLADLRTAVLEQLTRATQGHDGCTHLNDVLRSLAEVPVLVRPWQGSPARTKADL